ncbi:MAG: putative toxin-antitoxin system toxin component, PIN family [candidate division NC10 bacterium]|nr:putative toxin-antitoxin system toxin component, PIN family [candidate division NC10 bacterium]MBI4841535.1 putative toxin-antitoxin system toxin component, PIN family [candidate division NC10 bacterium]
MKIVLDTNVLVAGLLTPGGACGRVLDLVIEGVVETCVDERILREYEMVLRRPRLAIPPADARTALDIIRRTAEPVAPVPLPADLPDKDDVPFLEVAAAARAILVTGNLRHFPRKACKDVRVLSPAGLLDLLRRSV